MSSVSSVGTSAVDLYQWLSQITQQSPTTTPVSNATSASDPDAAAEAQGSNTANGTRHAGGHHHHHGFASKVESAVTTALQSAPSGSDPNQVIKDAITQALQGGQSGGKTGKAGNDGDADDQAGASTASSTSASGTTSANGSTSGSSFTQLLASYGVNAQQFQQDLQSALASQLTGGSGVDFATLFKSFPPGSMFQATA